MLNNACPTADTHCQSKAMNMHITQKSVIATHVIEHSKESTRPFHPKREHVFQLIWSRLGLRSIYM